MDLLSVKSYNILNDWGYIMLKKTLLALAIGVIGFTGAVCAQDDSNYTFIGDLKYNQVMLDAAKPESAAVFDFGTEPEKVGGHEQDFNRNTDGFPTAFRGGNTDSEIWVLDSLNGVLKLFNDKKLKKSIDIKKMGIVYDFAISSDNEYIAFLNRTTGSVYVTDPSGKVLTTVSGYEYATSIEFAPDNHILIVHPMGQGIVKLDVNGALKDTYISDGTLSNIANEKGLWGLDGIFTNNAKLFVRSGTATDSVKVLAEIPFKDFEGVEYKGGNIYGFDEKGNLYFGLVACDPNGVIYRDRLYKCNQEGKILKELDILDHSVISPNVPRHRTVNTFGRVYSLDADFDHYYLRSWNMGD